MDDIVKASLKKWPNVPHCYGWLALDARGDWYLRDEPTQATGPFPQIKGSRIEHAKLKEFIHRNYDHDERGAWFFQNGPQRVYVQLEAAPLILGVQRHDDGRYEVTAHTGEAIHEVGASWVDELGRLFLQTPKGLGLMRSLDMDVAADAIEAGLWDPQDVVFDTLPKQYRFDLIPQPA